MFKNIEFPVLKMSMDVSKDYRIGLLKTERGKRRKNIEMNVECYYFCLVSFENFF